MNTGNETAITMQDVVKLTEVNPLAREQLLVIAKDRRIAQLEAELAKVNGAKESVGASLSTSKPDASNDP